MNTNKIDGLPAFPFIFSQSDGRRNYAVVGLKGNGDLAVIGLSDDKPEMYSGTRPAQLRNWLKDGPTKIVSNTVPENSTISPLTVTVDSSEAEAKLQRIVTLGEQAEATLLRVKALLA